VTPEAAQVGGPSAARECGACSLCCTLLRVDELAKLGGTPCVHQRAAGGCGIYARRPGVCRAYRCLWLDGGLRTEDRPDRLGAVLDLVNRGGHMMLQIRESEPGAFDRSPRLREIAHEFRVAMPVRISDAASVLDPDRPFRVLLPGGEEQRVAGERIETWRDGRLQSARRQPWAERLARRVLLRVRGLRLRRLGSR
jgi:hypothetical protein